MAVVKLPNSVLADGVELDDAGAGERRPPVLPAFTFHEGRHTHATWLTEDGIPGDGESDPGCAGGTGH